MCSARSSRQAGGTGEYRCITGVKSRAEEKDRRDAANDLGELTGFFLTQGAAQQGLFPITEPLLGDLVAAEGILPDAYRGFRSSLMDVTLSPHSTASSPP
jgi:hypothetical protein